MALRRQNSRWSPWCFVATLLLLAVAAIGVGGAHLSGARAQPAALIDLLKKKAAAKGKPAVAAKKGLPGKGFSKGVPAGPKNAISKGCCPARQFQIRARQRTRNARRKRTDQSRQPERHGKRRSLKGSRPQRDGDRTSERRRAERGDNGRTVQERRAARARDWRAAEGLCPRASAPKAASQAPAWRRPRPERLRLRADHRLAIVAAQRLLPPRPLPGQRGFTGVPPVGETRFVSTELMLRIGPNVSRQSLDDTARRLGLTIISTQPSGSPKAPSITSG